MRDRLAIKQIVFELLNPKTIAGKNQLDKSFDKMIKNNQLKIKNMKNDNYIDGLQIDKTIEQLAKEYSGNCSAQSSSVDPSKHNARVAAFIAGYKTSEQEKEKVSIAFGSWLKNTVFDGDMPTLYGYFIKHIYNK